MDCVSLSNAQRIRIGRGLQQISAKFQPLRTTTVSQESEVADLDKAWWQHVKQETPDKLDGVNGHKLLGVVVGRVSPAEGQLSVSQFEQTSVGDGDACSVPDTSGRVRDRQTEP
jgi:hypothetical protein